MRRCGRGVRDPAGRRHGGDRPRRGARGLCPGRSPGPPRCRRPPRSIDHHHRGADHDRPAGHHHHDCAGHHHGAAAVHLVDPPGPDHHHAVHHHPAHDVHVVQHPVGPHRRSSWCWSSPSCWSPSSSARVGRRASRPSGTGPWSRPSATRSWPATRCSPTTPCPATPTLRGAVDVQVERAAVALERVARAAPDPQAAGLATEAAGSLRGLAFAVEADRLLHQGASAPTGVQLAEADEARRARNSELSAALSRLSTRIGAPPRSRGAR